MERVARDGCDARSGSGSHLARDSHVVVVGKEPNDASVCSCASTAVPKVMPKSVEVATPLVEPNRPTSAKPALLPSTRVTEPPAPPMDELKKAPEFRLNWHEYWPPTTAAVPAALASMSGKR